METQDRQAIDGLFNRLDQVDRQNAPRDPEAEALIKQRVGQSPNAPYLMAQTIVMQDFALEEAQRRIEELERRAQERPASGGGFLSGLFGGGSREPEPQPRRSAVPSVSAGGSPMGAPMGSPSSPMGAPGFGSQAQGAQPGQPARGGGFLAGAAQTAVGVAGGMLLGSAVASMFGGDEAKAAEAPAANDANADAGSTSPAAEPASDDGGFFDDVFGGGDEI